MKFKPGDKIKCIRAEPYMFGTVGETYIVRKHKPRLYGFEDGLTVEGSQKYNIDEARFELVTNNQESEGSSMKIVVGSKVRIKPQHADRYFKLGDVFVVSRTETWASPKNPITRISVEKDSTGTANGWCAEYFDLVDDASSLESLVQKYNEGQDAIREAAQKFGDRINIKTGNGNNFLLKDLGDCGHTATIIVKNKSFQWLNYNCTIQSDQIKIGCKSFKLDSLVKELGSALGVTKIDTDNTIGYFVSRTGIELEGNKFDWSQIEKLYRLIQEHNS